MSQSAVTVDDLTREVARRRTFAIISHPDAGKTTLTEKLLLYGGAINLAGAVRARKSRRQATSDWMELERERGISITAAALQFDVRGCRLNLLDTPGHQDFSEDTYRTLMAVDSAVMVLDGAKGIEAQTLKLFKVCRMRRIPIFTFINKMDAPSRDPLELMDEIEEMLGVSAAAMNWPIGEAPDFQGLFDFRRQKVLLFERTEHGQRRAPVQVTDVHDERLSELVGRETQKRLTETAELLAVAGTSFDRKRFLAGEMTPVYFGSAVNNFGVDEFLDAILELAPPPEPRQSSAGPVDPVSRRFSGFVFKIQANMDPRHRDQVAFMRVCSGRFERDMVVVHPTTGKEIHLSRPHRLFGGEREVMDEAYPGDIVGLASKGAFEIGDCLADGGTLAFDPIPRFQPEHFATLSNEDISKYKQFHKGLQQLEAEGVIQVFAEPGAIRRQPVLAAVGELQFEVLVSRLKMEYGVESRVERLPHTHCRWIEGEPEDVARIEWPVHGHMLLEDRDGRPVVLFSSEWQMHYCTEKNLTIRFTTWG
ncbi:MAG: peptide chain release factor 3 [Thermaerobacter sp.]|nr:peptide chain release factor 3 [Thermaerobacter sp.]